MSSFTQFTGSAVPFGQLISLWGDQTNPTIDGIEYLKTGVLKSSTGYSSLVSNWPSLGLNVQTGSAYSFEGGNGGNNFYLTDGTRYYVFSSAAGVSAIYGTSATSAWTTPVAGSNAINDVCRFGTSGTLIAVGTTATNNYYVTGITATAIPTTTAIMFTTASNTAGTLAVMCRAVFNGVNQIWTSTNGTTWTSRTPTGSATSSNIVRAMWSPVANCFVYLDSTAVAWTTTDGYTLTSRGVPTGLAAGAVNDTGLANNLFCASSASSTLFTIQQSSVGYIVKTTNGTSYTATPVSSLFPGKSTSTYPKLVYMNSAYYAIFVNGINAPSSNIYKSVDEGATWAPVSNIFISPLTRSGSGAFYYTDYVNVFNGNIIAMARAGTITTGSYGVLSSYDAANYIGVPRESSELAGLASNDANLPIYYVRIK